MGSRGRRLQGSRTTIARPSDLRTDRALKGIQLLIFLSTPTEVLVLKERKREKGKERERVCVRERERERDMRKDRTRGLLSFSPFLSLSLFRSKAASWTILPLFLVQAIHLFNNERSFCCFAVRLRPTVRWFLFLLRRLVLSLLPLPDERSSAFERKKKERRRPLYSKLFFSIVV